jgi:hypothetical protein
MNPLYSQFEKLARIAVPVRNDPAAKRAAREEFERLRAAGAVRIAFALLAALCVAVATLQRI